MLALLENDRVKAELKLTDQQVTRLHQIALEGEKAGIKTQAEMRVRGLELRELLRADQPEREVVVKKVQEISDLRGQMMRQHVESLLAAKTVLTPEQQQRFRALGARRGHSGPGGGWMGHRGPRMGRGPPEPPTQ
jgi:Spy/CpxP family protein refolding chaperone